MFKNQPKPPEPKPTEPEPPESSQKIRFVYKISLNYIFVFLLLYQI